MSEQTWDIGSPEPDGVEVVRSMCGIFDDEDCSPLRFSRTCHGEWKTYLNGNLYLEWNEVVRRFGPVDEAR